MTNSESIEKPSSLQVGETVIIYLIAVVLLTGVMVLAFLSWQG
jgi:hypothetical protein